ncbi:hypothetical protein DICPUDRAFT_81675 [Dictyostelium purpureum]|uniref:Uncharacterized protein n=1 Tax=Dictyostelium purpureum TaxID=5786 RepID=F0ZU85_DICPU|nr:uncharacterized protein DICPUDRAFT_81675 [Dictyostelium purpureum]EGC32482.1 hypothetical protein DICPUDRAFT_81675 [Dictyostelium purpureum]|eukprot:XP_003290975.1 hypothetical protein DICPUDRAFT_81675 [Dictyostelium purpureum]
MDFHYDFEDENSMSFLEKEKEKEIENNVVPLSISKYNDDIDIVQYYDKLFSFEEKKEECIKKPLVDLDMILTLDDSDVDTNSKKYQEILNILKNKEEDPIMYDEFFDTIIKSKDTTGFLNGRDKEVEEDFPDETYDSDYFKNSL